MIIHRKSHRVLVSGITGKQGTFWTEKMVERGTHVVAGVNPKRAGEIHHWRAGVRFGGRGDDENAL